MKIDCLEIYNRVKEDIKTRVAIMREKPSFVCYLTENEDGTVDAGSEIYTRLKLKTADECGVKMELRRLKAYQILDELETPPRYCMLQLPSNKAVELRFKELVATGEVIDPDFLDVNTYLDIASGFMLNIPATPRAVMTVVENYFDGCISGRKIAVVGSRSKTVGKYLPLLLQDRNATVSMYHSKSVISKREFEGYDCIISCVGIEGFIKTDQVYGDKPKLLVGVGVSRGSDGKVKSDFEEDNFMFHDYTPKVNGIGLLTRIYLIDNLVKIFEREA